MRAGGVGQVVAVEHPKLRGGRPRHRACFGVQEYAVLPTATRCTKVDPALAPLPAYLGALGMPGMTAYFGLLDIGKPQGGRDRGRLRRGGRGRHDRRADREDQGLPRGRHRRRAREVPRSSSTSSASTPPSTTRARTCARALREHCPDGIDVYFDNVGGEILDAALARLALRRAHRHLRRDLAVQRTEGDATGPSNYMSLLVNRARMKGFVVFDYADRYARGRRARWRGWMAEGKLKSREDVVEAASRPSPTRCSSSSRARTPASSCCRRRRPEPRAGGRELRAG